MLTEESESNLLKQAIKEEKAYNLAEAAKLYELIAKSYLDKHLLEEAARLFEKAGEAYYIAYFQANSKENSEEITKKGVNVFKEAADIFKQNRSKFEELECRALNLLLESIRTDSIIESRKKCRNALELIKQSYELCIKNDDQNALARILNRLTMISGHLIFLCDEPEEIIDLYQKGMDKIYKACEVALDVKNLSYFALSWFWGMQHLTFAQVILDFRKDERYLENLKKFLLIFKKNLGFFENYNNSIYLAMIYLTAGNLYFTYGFHIIDDEIEQNEYFNKSINLSEKALDNARKVSGRAIIIPILFVLNWWSMLFGRFQYVQKRIISDIDEIIELGNVYEGYSLSLQAMSFYLPAFYYANIAQMSLFNFPQRKIYAEKGIEYALKILKCTANFLFSLWAYHLLILSHSQLSYLNTAKNKRDEHIKKMLDYVNEVKKVSENCEGGFGRATRYACIYRAHKTLSNLSHNEEEKIKMLSIAIDASKNYLGCAIESRTGIIAGKMRLGLLYEELSLLDGKIDTIMEARDLFLQIIEECQERGYRSYLAATYEYIARLEDRMGNFTASAKYYEKAQSAYFEALKNIEYRPLKRRVNEKLNYTKAWNLIENAKAYHKNDNYLKAKDYYNSGSNLLKNLPNFNYEAYYYSAWALQEDAEQASKQELHEEAIIRFEDTKTYFNDARKMMEKISKRSKDKSTVMRVQKLEKVAKLRINYCSARSDIERARILEKQGDHTAAADLFASAASQFRYICNLFKVERERNELEAIYYLCRAWESMELAEKYEDPERFAEAANLFEKAGKLFMENSMKFLASGNAAFCQALEYGCEFDETIETNIKAELYPRIKIMVRKAAESYRKGGFTSGADWALATSIYFDAAWSLIRADEDLDFEQKNEFLRVGSEYLRSAADLFAKSGNIHKNQEVLERLNMVEKEKKIIFSALNSITKPSISSSTTGITAPACSLETSQSPRLGEVYQFNEEERRVIQEKVLRRKYEIKYRDLLKEYSRVQKRECRVGVAQIGVSKSGNIINEFYEMKGSGLLGLREDKIDTIRTKIKAMIENAAENGVNILIFPEMTIDLNYRELIKDISDLAKLYNMYVIPGSYHDQESKRNLSLVIGPDGILWEQEKHIPATIHLGKKMFKEAIEVGTLPRTIIVCNTEYGRIAIAICRDFLDMDLRVELKNFEPPVDILLNPAFTPVTADFKAAHFDARRSIYAYCFFANVGEFGDSLIYTPEKERIERTISAKEEGLIYKDVDLFKLRSERKKWEKKQSKERLFIQSTR
ncbi:MAG: nitrilase-related carbon-nitrogen hydrolase [Candidatus Hermodarchaeota archaeon]